MTNLSIQTFNGLINNQPEQLINARDLHQFLKISTKFQDWINRRISDYNFTENLDFIVILKIENVDRGFLGTREIEVKNYHLTIDMAKELCMLERSELGQQARRYFIKMEKQALQAYQSTTLSTQKTTLATMVNVSKDRYIELLENENQLLRTQPNPKRKKAPIPLTDEEKIEILKLHCTDLSVAQIAQKIGRSKSAVRSIIREN